MFNNLGNKWNSLLDNLKVSVKSQQPEWFISKVKNDNYLVINHNGFIRYLDTHGMLCITRFPSTSNLVSLDEAKVIINMIYPKRMEQND